LEGLYFLPAELGYWVAPWVPFFVYYFFFPFTPDGCWRRACPGAKEQGYKMDPLWQEFGKKVQ